MHTIYDFNTFEESRMKVTNDLRFIRYESNNDTNCYERVNKGSNEFRVIMNSIENIQ